MTDHNSRQIKINLETEVIITEFQLAENINEHSWCRLKGIVEDDSKDALITNMNGKEHIKVSIEDTGKKITLFCGIVHSLSIFQKGGVHTFSIELVSPSFLLDAERKSRSFQNKDMTYSEVISHVIKDYQGGEIFDRIGEGKKISRLIVQYLETDWEFLKRLSSHFNASVFPSSQFESPKIYFGRRSQLDIGEIDTYEYKVQKELSWLKKCSTDRQWELKNADAICYVVKSHKYYELSSKVKFKESWFYIKKCEGILKSGEIVFQYTLVTEQGMGQIKRYPKQLQGASLEGKVLKSVANCVKVHLDIDQNQDESTAWEFPYQTMYAAEGEGGWYCMPETGDAVSIFFTEADEEKAVASASTRLGKVRDEKTEDPSIKYFRTIYGKEIRFTQTSVEISCIDTDEKSTRIILHQNKGITLETTEDITFKSEKGIQIEARESLELYASEQIKLRCKKGKIQMDRLIDIAGPDVRIN